MKRSPSLLLCLLMPIVILILSNTLINIDFSTSFTN